MTTVDVLLFSDYTGIPFSRYAGAYRLATELRKHGYSVKVVEHFLLAGVETTLKIIEKFVGANTMIVGFSTTFLNAVQGYEHIDDTARFQYSGKEIHLPSLTKKYSSVVTMTPNGIAITNEDLILLKQHILIRAPKAKLVMGGTAAYYEERQPNIDVFVTGLADAAIIDLLRFIKGENPFLQYKLVANGNALLLDGDAIGSTFDFQNATIEYQADDYIRKDEPLTIETARGCIFKCKFCSYKFTGKHKLDFLKNPEVLYSEFMNNFDRFGTTRYIFADDTFNDSTTKIEQIAKTIQKLPFKIEYAAYIRHDLIHRFPEQADILKESGLSSAVFGIETMNYKSGKAIGKGLHPEKTKELLYWLRDEKGWKNRILTYSGFIVGLPHDTPETVQKWAGEILSPDFPLDSMMFTVLAIFPFRKNFSKSEFERDYQKYGYRFDEGPVHWRNDIWSRREAELLSSSLNETVNKQRRNKTPGFSALKFAQYGFTNEQVFNNSWVEIIRQFDLRAGVRQHADTYLSNILK